MNVHTLEPYGFERMTRREKAQASLDQKFETFRRALWDLRTDVSRAEIRELFESEMKL